MDISKVLSARSSISKLRQLQVYLFIEVIWRDNIIDDFELVKQTRDVLIQYWYSIDTVLTQYWYSIDTVLTQYWHSIDTVLTQYWYSIYSLTFVASASANIPNCCK